MCALVQTEGIRAKKSVCDAKAVEVVYAYIHDEEAWEQRLLHAVSLHVREALACVYRSNTG